MQIVYLRITNDMTQSQQKKNCITGKKLFNKNKILKLYLQLQFLVWIS